MLNYDFDNKEQKMTEKIKVALLVDEFFGGAGTAFGGYGFLARRYICRYIPCEDISIDVLLKRGTSKYFAKRYRIDGTDVYYLPKDSRNMQRFLRKKNYDIYLSIELTNPSADIIQKDPGLADKQLILWIQDPRPKYEWDEIETVKLFPEKSYYLQPTYNLVNRMFRRGHVSFISQGYFLNPKAIDLYGLLKYTPIRYLPNPVDIDESFDVSTYPKKDMIIFLGRIESVKRGWLFCEIAKAMPEYEFYVLGKTTREKERNSAVLEKYMPIPNLHFAGHVDGQQKEQFLKDAKILVNTSIHEALPVSFLEALSYGTVLVSNRNPENLTSKFGIWTGDVFGDGFDKVGLYTDAIRELMTNNAKRSSMAEAAVRYIREIHNVPRFVRDLRAVIRDNMCCQNKR